MREQRRYFGRHFALSGQRDFYFVGVWWSSSHSSSSTLHRNRLIIYLSHDVDEEQIIIVIKTDSASLLLFLLDVTLMLLWSLQSFCVSAVILNLWWSELEQLVGRLWIRAVWKSLAQNLIIKLEQIIWAVSERDRLRKEGWAELMVVWALRYDADLKHMKWWNNWRWDYLMRITANGWCRPALVKAQRWWGSERMCCMDTLEKLYV